MLVRNATTLHIACGVHQTSAAVKYQYVKLAWMTKYVSAPIPLRNKTVFV